jgi:hypothetical protein
VIRIWKIVAITQIARKLSDHAIAVMRRKVNLQQAIGRVKIGELCAL